MEGKLTAGTADNIPRIIAEIVLVVSAHIHQIQNFQWVMLPSCDLHCYGKNDTVTLATAGRRGDRPVHDVPGVEHRAQGACSCVHVQPVPDCVLGVHLSHLLRTMDRPRMVMLLLHPLKP